MIPQRGAVTVYVYTLSGQAWCVAADHHAVRFASHGCVSYGSNTSWAFGCEQTLDGPCGWNRKTIKFFRLLLTLWTFQEASCSSGSLAWNGRSSWSFVERGWVSNHLWRIACHASDCPGISFSWQCVRRWGLRIVLLHFVAGPASQMWIRSGSDSEDLMKVHISLSTWKASMESQSNTSVDDSKAANMSVRGQVDDFFL